MEKNVCLNLGCDRFKIGNFINLDVNPEVHPDICLNALDLDKHFQENSIDFIFAGHILEHFNIEDSEKVVQKCYLILKKFRSIVIVVPDYSKCTQLGIDTELAERVILANGAHKALFNSDRLFKLLQKTGFKCVTEITDLNQVPYLLVANTLDPKPDLWQTAFIAMKI